MALFLNFGKNPITEESAELFPRNIVQRQDTGHL